MLASRSSRRAPHFSAEPFTRAAAGLLRPVLRLPAGHVRRVDRRRSRASRAWRARDVLLQRVVHVGASAAAVLRLRRVRDLVRGDGPDDRPRHSSFETTAYRWARLGYLPLTFGMLLGFPWALMAWQGEAWWWSGKVNMSIMMWLLYTAYLHARLYLRRQGMWKAVAALAVLSFLDPRADLPHDLRRPGRAQLRAAAVLARWEVPRWSGRHRTTSVSAPGTSGSRCSPSCCSPRSACSRSSARSTCWWAERTIPGWEQAGYTAFVAAMNAIAAPQLCALVVVMGLCVPKRLFSRRRCSRSRSRWSLRASWRRVASSAPRSRAHRLPRARPRLIQVAVVVLTAAGVRGPSYLTEGRLTKIGSGLLHLGFIVFAIVVVALQRSPLMLPVFWASAVLVTVGTALSFYADKLAWHRPHGEPAWILGGRGGARRGRRGHRRDGDARGLALGRAPPAGRLTPRGPSR